jgi:RND family efflux transporter MFP subunit
MNKKKIIISIITIAAIFIVAMRISNKKSAIVAAPTKQEIKVSVQSASESKMLLQKNQYPVNVAGDQEVKITAKSSGTVVVAPGNVGDRVNVGTLLTKIDDNGTLGIGDNGLQSLQVQQSQLAAEQARKSYSLAKDNYNNLKKSSTSTTAQKDAAKASQDIAKLQYENSLLGLNGSVDNHLITSPISGTITNKAVSIGDSVTVGQLLATVSKTSNVKIQFYVDQQQLKNLTRGQKISVTDSTGKETIWIIRNFSSTGDSVTKKFLVEAYGEKNSTPLLAGTIATATIETNLKSTNSANLLLPLSAISIGQNESHIFVAENNLAKKIEVDVISVNGENAEISANISDQASIIIDGNKLISDGEKITL